MSYSNPNRRMYTFDTVDFGAGANTTFHILGPKSKAGRLVDYGVYGVSEAFAGSTTRPQMSIGTVADPDAYGDEFDLGTLAIASGGKSILTTYRESEAGFATYMLNTILPADTVILVTCVAATGTPTGMANTFVLIDWDD